MDFASSAQSTASVQIVTSVFTPAVDGASYSATLNATGGSGNYAWSIDSGVLPTGLTLDAQSGAINGMSTAAGDFDFTLKVQDEAVPAQVSSRRATLKVLPRLTVREKGVQTAMVGTSYSDSIVASGGVAPYKWSVSGGSLAPGLQIGTNAIAGVPTAAGTYKATVQVSDSGALVQTVSVPVTLTVSVAPLVVTAPSFTAGVAGQAYTPVTIPVTGGLPSYSWSVVSGSLPAGLVLSASSGVLSGTPTKAGIYAFLLRVKDSELPASAGELAGLITVAAAPVKETYGTTWYVRPDGGTRYSGNRTLGQCDGKSDAAYSGTGTNQHCAFNDVRFLYLDGSYNTGSNQGWVISGGDTVILRGSIASGVSYRIGWNNKNAAYESTTDTNWGVAGDPYGSGMPAPPSGTAAHPTRILGENYGACHTQSARTQLHGGFGVSSVINLNGAAYVDMECLDVTDFSACGRAGQSFQCNTNPGSLDDYASSGISQNNKTTHLTLADVRIHGTAGTGLYGPNGDGNLYSYVDIVGNASSGWNADDGTAGVGSALMQNFSISWNGCAEQYPLVAALPYGDCTDDNSGGYGDGFGTATVTSTKPWNVTFNIGTVSYNTQDGLDALHLTGAGSSMTITRVMSYGNMGQQIKVGGAGGTAINNVIVTNCNALRQAIPGTPAGYNTKLSDFCRAADAGIFMATQDGTTTRFDSNTVYSASSTTIEIGCGGTCKAGTDVIDFRNNIILGFKNSAATGYPGGGTGDYANPIYLDYNNPFLNAGSVMSHNLMFHSKSNWTCPAATWLHETGGLCADPGLVDEAWHTYGVGVMSPVTGNSVVLGGGVAIADILTSFSGQTRGLPPSIGAYE